MVPWKKVAMRSSGPDDDEHYDDHEDNDGSRFESEVDSLYDDERECD